MSSPHTPFKLASNCENQVMAFYQAKIRQQNQFLTLIKSALAETLAEHVLSCVVSGKILLLYTESDEWATQLRYHEFMMLNALHSSNLAAIEAVQVRLVSQPAPPMARKVKPPSKKNIELMRDNLQSVADEGLKQALLRLSQTLDKLP